MQFIYLVYNDDWGSIPDQAYLAQWAKVYGYTTVAALAPLEPNPSNLSQESKQVSWVWDIDGGLPSVYHLDRNMRVISADSWQMKPPKLNPVVPCKGCQY